MTTIQQELDGFLSDHDAVTVAAFGDLLSGLVLKHSSRSACPREILDQMGAKAAEVFSHFDSIVELATMDGLVVQFTESSLQVSVRPKQNGEDLVCLALRPGTAVGSIYPSATALAERLARAS